MTRRSSKRRAAENVGRWSAPLEEAGESFKRADVPPQKKVVPEPKFAVEDNPKPVDRPMPERAPTTDELLEAQRMDFAPEEAVPPRGSIDYDETLGQQVIPLPAGVKVLPKDVMRGRDGKLYVTIANGPRGRVQVAQNVAEQVAPKAPEVAQAV